MEEMVPGLRQFWCVLAFVGLAVGCEGPLASRDTELFPVLPEELSGDPGQLTPLPTSALIGIFRREFSNIHQTRRILRRPVELCLWEMIRRGGSECRDAVRVALEEASGIFAAA